MKKDDIVLIPFPFTDLSGNKNRPAVIFISSEDDVTVSFITSQMSWQAEFDILLQPSYLNGLKKASLIRLNKFATIDKELVLGRIGRLDREHLDMLNNNLIKILKLDS